MHDGPAWPLYLVPRRLPSRPPGRSPGTREPIAASGDHIGECVTNSSRWRSRDPLPAHGAATGTGASPCSRSCCRATPTTPERRRDIGVATALGLQFRERPQHPALLRPARAAARGARPPAAPALAQMRAHRATRELDGGRASCCALPRPTRAWASTPRPKATSTSRPRSSGGWSSCATCSRRASPAIEAQVRAGEPLWPDYTGRQPEGPAYRCRRVDGAPALTAPRRGRDGTTSRR